MILKTGLVNWFNLRVTFCTILLIAPAVAIPVIFHLVSQEFNKNKIAFGTFTWNIGIRHDWASDYLCDPNQRWYYVDVMVRRRFRIQINLFGKMQSIYFVRKICFPCLTSYQKDWRRSQTKNWKSCCDHKSHWKLANKGWNWV